MCERQGINFISAFEVDSDQICNKVCINNTVPVQNMLLGTVAVNMRVKCADSVLTPRK